MILTFEAVDAKGQRTSDTVEAGDSQEAVELLRRRGLFVTSIAKSKRSSKATAGSKVAIKGVRIPLKMLLLMTRQLAMLLRSGSDLVPAFAAIQRQMINPAHSALMGRVVTDLEEGQTLTEAMKKHPRTFNALYTAVVSAGEASANLPDMFDRLATIVGKQRATRNKIIGALAYPVLLTMMCSNIVVGLLFFVIPRFSDMFDQLGVEPPETTLALLAVGSFLRAYWWAVAMAGAAALSGVAYAAMTASGRQWLSNIQLSIPVIGPLRRKLIQAQVFRTMGMLLESRVGILESLELVRRSTTNNRFQRLFDNLVESVTTGGTVGGAFEASGLVEPYVCQAIRTGEESGNIGIALTYCADMLDETNTELINTVMKLVEPLILIVMGTVVGSVAVSLFMPLFDLTSAMG